MTKENFMSRWNNIKNPLCEKYGVLLYFLASDVINISHMEKVCEEMGYKTKRKQFEGAPTMAFSEIYHEDKHIGNIDNQGLPSVQIYKRNGKHATKISAHETIIEPIKGVHRILDWHTTKGKFHKLAGGEIVLHFLPVDITDEIMNDFLTKTKLIDKVEEFKKHEEKTLGKDFGKMC